MIGLGHAVGPPIFFGRPGATTASIIAFWIVFYVWIGSELWIGYRRRLPKGTVSHDSRSRIWLISSVWGTVAAGIGLAFAFPDAAITRGRIAVFIAGLILMIAGLVLRWYSIRVLGRWFTVEVAARSGQVVVESGPYRWVRHPSYAGALMTIVGVLLCCANVASLAAIVLIAVAYAYRIRLEEEVLATDLGPAYRDYMRRTKRLIPFLL